jgi:hypothetical protein
MFNLKTPIHFSQNLIIFRKEKFAILDTKVAISN